MPAAAMAARSGDAVILAERDELPAPSVEALSRHEKPDVFILGPESVIGPEVEGSCGRSRAGSSGSRARRPVQNAIAFARFQSGTFGWGAEVPGQNFTIASRRGRSTPSAPHRSRRTACSRRFC